MTTPRYGTLFHFTHIDNIDAIVAAGVLMSDNEVQPRGLLSNECGNLSIKERRRRREVTCEPGGVVADYVPFYYAARSPMMLLIASGRVPTFTGDHRDLVYFVTSVNRVVELGLPFAISDRNATLPLADFSNDLAVLGGFAPVDPRTDFVDWPLMKQTYWNDTDEYPDRKERRMAEFLVRGTFPLTGLIGIAAQNDRVRERVERAFDAASLPDLQFAVRPNWYY